MDLHAIRSIYNICLMSAVAAEHGLPLARALAGTGVDPQQLEDPKAEVEVAQELAVIDNLVRELGHVPALGFETGLRFHMSVYGTFAFAMCSCATLRDVLLLGERYSALTFTLLDKRFEVTADELILVFDDRHIQPDSRRYVIERDFAALLNIYRELFATNLPGLRSEVNFPRPDYADRYLTFRDVDFRFDAPRIISACSISVLDMPLPQANPHALRFCEAELDELMQRKLARAGIAGQVRQILLRRLRQAPDMDTVANELHMTARTLRRQLDAEGVSFRGLVEEVRQTMAEELLSIAQLGVKEVADRLGYFEIASFITAFKRWKGMPPGEWRSANVARPRLSLRAHAAARANSEAGGATPGGKPPH
jgi:AraC-like DNA-binding protein